MKQQKKRVGRTGYSATPMLYKNHVLVDCITGLPICELATTANVADSIIALDILEKTNQYLCSHLTVGNCAGCFCLSTSEPHKGDKTLFSLCLIPSPHHITRYFHPGTVHFRAVTLCHTLMPFRPGW